jgi:hypothetical protein
MRRLGKVIALGVLGTLLGASPALAAVADPDTFIDSTPAALTNQTSATFTFHSNDPTATFKCKHDSTGFGTCTSPRTIDGFGEGSHTFEVEAVNAAGTDPTPASYTWTVDLTPPVTTITAQPPALSDSRTATFAFSSNEPGSTFQCSLNGATPQTCASPVTYTSLSDGQRTFSVHAVDAAGNVDTTVQPITWTVDATPPETAISFLSAAGEPLRRNPQPIFQLTSPDTTVTSFQCSLNGAAYTVCGTSPNCTQHYVVSGHCAQPTLQNGAQVFRVRAVDPAGNVDPTPAVIKWTVDLTPPLAPSVGLVPDNGASASSAVPGFSLVAPSTPSLLFVAKNLLPLGPTPVITLATKLFAQWGDADSTAVSYGVDLYTMDGTGEKVIEHIKKRAIIINARPGATVCVAVWAYDSAGNISKSTTRCTTIPQPLAPPTNVGSLQRVRDPQAWQGYYVKLKAHDALIWRFEQLGNVGIGTHDAIVAERCRTCGKVEAVYAQTDSHGKLVQHGHEIHIATINLHSNQTSGPFKLIQFRRLVNAPPQDGFETFVLALRRVSGTPRISGTAFQELPGIPPGAGLGGI